MDVDFPFVSPVLIAREQEEKYLKARYGAAADYGTGSIVILSGEAGVGKTRLLRELTAWSETQGGIGLMAQCVESERAHPFGLVRDLFHAIVRLEESGKGEICWDRHATELMAVAPELINELQLDHSSFSIDSPFDGHRVSFAVTSMMRELADHRPMTVAFEDLHWCDDASLNCLLHVARGISSLPTLMIMTYRREDASPALSHMLADLDRARLATELDLLPLEEIGTANMLRSVFALDRQPRPALVKALQNLTGGNPFFIEEVLASLIAGGGIYQVEHNWERKRLDVLPVPRSVKDAVQTRLNTVSSGARNILVLAAIAGQRIDIDVLSEASGLDETALMPLLRELIGVHVLVEDRNDGVAFRHALTRHAVESDLLARERAALHRQVFQALVRVAGAHPERYLDDLSRQAAASGRASEALEYGQLAGLRALSLGAPYAALEHLGHVIDAAEELAMPVPATAYLNRGRAYEMTGNFDDAGADFEAGLKQASQDGETLAIWRAHLDLGLLWCSRDYSRALTHFEEALRIARAGNDERMLGESLNRMGNWLANDEQPEPAIAHHREALAIFSRLGDRIGEADTHELMSMAGILGGDLKSATESGKRAADIYRELGDLLGQMRTMEAELSNAISDLSTFVGWGDLNRLAESQRALVRIARDVGDRPGESFLLSILGQAYLASGAYGPAVDTLNEALTVAREIGHSQWKIQAMWGLSGAYQEIGDSSTSLEFLQASADLVGTLQSETWTNGIAGGMASAWVALGEIGEAEIILNNAWTVQLPMVTQGQRHLWCARIEMLLATGRPDEAVETLNAMYENARNVPHHGAIPRLALLKAQGLKQIRDSQSAAALLRSALAWNDGQGALPQALRIHTALANVLVSTDHLAAAEEHVEASLDLIDRIAKATQEPELRETFTNSATDRLPAVMLRYRAKTDRFAGGLTRRQAQVAALVRDGLTNRAIAERLFVAERTAEAHVAGVMRRLGFTSRAQVAAWASLESLPPVTD